jgi:NADPH-dependent F420 reductase
VAILGGTGHLGRGLALRLAAAGSEIVIGSRDPARAARAAAALVAALVPSWVPAPPVGARGAPAAGDVPSAGVPPAAGVATGAANADAARSAEIVVIAVPLEGHAALVESLSGALDGKIVVDATVPMAEGRAYAPPAAGSAAAETQALAPGARVVAAFHTVSARLLADLSRPLDQDVLVCGDDPEARARVMALADAIGARGVDAGGLEAAAALEALAVLVIGLNIRYRRRDLGVRVAHLPTGAWPARLPSGARPR